MPSPLKTIKPTEANIITQRESLLTSVLTGKSGFKYTLCQSWASAYLFLGVNAKAEEESIVAVWFAGSSQTLRNNIVDLSCECQAFIDRGGICEHTKELRSLIVDALTLPEAVRKAKQEEIADDWNSDPVGRRGK